MVLITNEPQCLLALLLRSAVIRCLSNEHRKPLQRILFLLLSLHFLELSLRLLSLAVGKYRRTENITFFKQVIQII